MSTKRTSTRRSFIAVTGAALAAPVAAAAASLPAQVERRDTAQARLELLEDLNAIRALNQAYVRQVNARAHAQIAELFDEPAAAPLDERVRGISVDSRDEDDPIVVAADRQTATARLRRTVQVGTAIAPDCTLVEMARLQGGGFVVSEESRVFENVYVRRDGVWKFQRSEQRPA